jgi:peptide chain release factor 1
MIVPEEAEWKLNDRDITVFTKKSSGPGGQHVNTTDSCVVMRHIPTGIEAIARERCQHTNKKNARSLLEAKVRSYFSNQEQKRKNDEKRDLRGAGMRGDKIKTYRSQDDIVTNHVTGEKIG